MPHATQSKAGIAVFDFDSTITYCDSFLPFLRDAAGPVRFWFGMAKSSPILIGHVLGLINNHTTKAAVIGTFFKGMDSEAFAKSCLRFVDGRLNTLINPRAMERIRWHQQNGDRVILLSASLEEYLRYWSDKNKIETTLATRLEKTNGKISGRLDGKNCHGDEKVCRLKQELANLDQFHIYSYGDSESDKPVLSLAHEPCFRRFDDCSGVRRQLSIMLRLARALL